MVNNTTPDSSPETVKFPMFIAYDKERNQIGCAILQSLYLGTIDNYSLQRFNNWLLAPTDNLKVYRLDSEEQLEQVILITNSIHTKS